MPTLHPPLLSMLILVMATGMVWLETAPQLTMRARETNRSEAQYLAYAMSLDQNISAAATSQDYINTIREDILYRTGYKLKQIHSRNSFGAEIEMALPAGCQPSLSPVEVTLTNLSSSSVVYPPCTRLERCGGCCSHPLLSCQPSKVEKIDKQVIIIDLETQADRQEVVSLSRHLECSCQCRTKAKDCTSRQHYLPGECRCECSNRLDREVCQGQHKFWDEQVCGCRCDNRGDTTCSTGHEFSNNSCRCERKPKKVVSTNRPPSRPRSRG